MPMTDLDISKGLIIRELISNYDDDPNNNFKKQLVLWEKNSSARLSLFLVHFFDIHWMTLRWNPLIWIVFCRTLTHNDKFFFLFLNLDKVLKNSTSGKVACIWHIEQVQIDAIKIVPGSMITCHFSCGDPENECPALLCFSLICLQQGESWYLYLHFLELCCKKKKESFLCVEKLEFTNEGCNEI